MSLYGSYNLHMYIHRTESQNQVKTHNPKRLRTSIKFALYFIYQLAYSTKQILVEVYSIRIDEIDTILIV
ncbi:UNVERIFIED_CONTAM: hypothetical protein NCL1_13019 [Trichonephila clavipes]